jgi:hypothetical protein
MAREHRSLAAIIREHSGGKRVEPQDKLVLRTQVGDPQGGCRRAQHQAAAGCPAHTAGDTGCFFFGRGRSSHSEAPWLL